MMTSISGNGVSGQGISGNGAVSTHSNSQRDGSEKKGTNGLRRNFILGIIGMAFVLVFGSSEAEAAKLLTIDNAPIEGSLSLEQIKEKIFDAGKKRGWRSKEISPGVIESTIHVRTHMAQVEIKFDQKSYSILYKDSKNLKYKEEKGKIHSAYNKWITNLKNDIDLEFSF